MNVQLSRSGAVARLTLDRPAKRNALTLGMLRELGTHLQQLAEDDSTRVVVLEGAGASFSVGADVTERAVLELRPEGLTVVEVAPGVDLQRDVLDKAEFPLLVADPLERMDPALFSKDTGGLLPALGRRS